MTGSKFFIDTAPLIYLVEENPKFVEKISLFLADSIQNNSQLITSVLTVAEFEIKPRKLNRLDVISKFDKIAKAAFIVEPISWDIAKISAGLRAKYSSLKGIDSLQVACALNNDCEYSLPTTSA